MTSALAILDDPWDTVAFAVDGLPIPQGHIRAFSNGGRIHYAHGSPGLKRWRTAVSSAAQAACRVPTDRAVLVTVVFYMPRPKDHHRANGALKVWAPAYPAVRPDVDRLARAVLDAITGPILADDAQVAALEAHKVYADAILTPGARVTVRVLG